MLLVGGGRGSAQQRAGRAAPAGCCRAGPWLCCLCCHQTTPLDCASTQPTTARRYLKDVKVGQGLSMAQALAGQLGPKLQGQVRRGAGARVRGVSPPRQQHCVGDELRCTS